MKKRYETDSPSVGDVAKRRGRKRVRTGAEDLPLSGGRSHVNTPVRTNLLFCFVLFSLRFLVCFCLSAPWECF